MQIVTLQNLIAAYDALYLQSSDKEWTFFHWPQKKMLEAYLETKNVDISQKTIAQRLEENQFRYSQLTQGLPPNEVPCPMRTDAQRLAILENIS